MEEDVANVGAISANNDMFIGKLLADAAKAADAGTPRGRGFLAKLGEIGHQLLFLAVAVGAGDGGGIDAEAEVDVDSLVSVNIENGYWRVARNGGDPTAETDLSNLTAWMTRQ